MEHGMGNRAILAGALALMAGILASCTIPLGPASSHRLTLALPPEVSAAARMVSPAAPSLNYWLEALFYQDGFLRHRDMIQLDPEAQAIEAELTDIPVGEYELRVTIYLEYETGDMVNLFMGTGTAELGEGGNKADIAVSRTRATLILDFYEDTGSGLVPVETNGQINRLVDIIGSVQRPLVMPASTHTITDFATGVYSVSGSSELSPPNGWGDQLLIVTGPGTHRFSVIGSPTQSVNLDLNDGYPPEEWMYPVGSLVIPEQPNRDGYIFAGWYRDAELTIPWRTGSDTVQGPMTLYAAWVVDPNQT